MSQMFYNAIGVLKETAPLVQTHPDVPITAWTGEESTFYSVNG
jgi:hypothetical protein